jgi:signal transduction histidine kinase
MLRLSFAARIGLIVILALLVAWISSVALFYFSRSAGNRDQQPLASQIVALTDLLERAPAEQRPLILRAVTSRTFLARVEPGLDVRRTPRQLVPRVATRVLNEYLQALGGRPVSVSLSKAYGEQPRRARRSFVTPVDLEFRVGLRTGETLIIDARHTPVRNVLGLPTGFLMGLVGSLIGLVAIIIMHRETKPLARLAGAVDRMDLSGSAATLPEQGSSAPEIRALIAAFNRLQGRLSQLLRARMAMLGGISHDVRTFATRLRLRVDQIPEGVERERAIADIADMIRLLDDALLASRAGAGELAEELVEFDELVKAEVEDRRAASNPVDLKLALQGHEAVVLGDRLALRRVIANLLDNARNYGQVAHVTLEADGKHLVLLVDDEGPGIPAEQREAMLEPFVRLEGSRNRRTGGAGLGLAVVRNLVEAHGGTVTIGEAPGAGARVEVRLPLFRSA